MPKLLVIDDEAAIIHAFERAFADGDVELFTAGTARDGELLYAAQRPDAVVLDLRLPDQSGLDCFKQLREIDARTPVIFITGHGTVETAIEATKLGAYDYLFKPLELKELRAVLDKAFHLSRMIRVQPAIPGTDENCEGSDEPIVGRCAAMREVYTAIGRVAPQNVTVLLLGESGTGKELIAQAIYHHSNRSSGPFQAINCAAIPDTLLESEIFGHERGSFTGAEHQRVGKLEQADGGTLFLDEVGDLSPLAQAKLLRVLQDQTFERVGSNTPTTVDVRIIAATNHDLKQLVSEGLFRADLFFRLSVITIELPPLRSRDGDIGLLAEHFLRKYAREFGKEMTGIPAETHALLSAYSWPGNVRELESVIKQSLLNARGRLLLSTFLPPLIAQASAPISPVTTDSLLTREFIQERLQAGSTSLYSEAIAVAERLLLCQVLAYTHGNQFQAARILGISRVTLRSKVRALGIDLSEFTR